MLSAPRSVGRGVLLVPFGGWEPLLGVAASDPPPHWPSTPVRRASSRPGALLCPHRRDSLPTPALPGARAGTTQPPIMGHPMTTQDRPDFVSVAEAARILGISKSTVKRRIVAGQLDAEQLQRAQGLEYRVRIHR